MVEGFSRVAGLHFLPEDRPGIDRALVAGVALQEVGDSPLVLGLSALADALLPDTVVTAPRRGSRGSLTHRGGRGSRGGRSARRQAHLR